jgi:hypothetical protein
MCRAFFDEGFAGSNAERSLFVLFTGSNILLKEGFILIFAGSNSFLKEGFLISEERLPDEVVWSINAFASCFS